MKRLLGWFGIGVFGALSAAACGGNGTVSDVDASAETSDTTGPADGTSVTPDGTNVTPDGSETSNPGDTGGPGDAEVDVAPTITSVTAHVAGAKGFDLALVIVGGDADRDAALVRVRLFDSADQPVLAFRSGLDATPDSNEQLVGFTPPVTGELSFIASVRLRGLVDEHPDIARVEVAVRDAAGHFSADVRSEVVPQVVRQLGDACDPDAIEDRCAGGLGCRGTPAQCQEGLAPEITKVAYLQGEGGTRILIQGTDPEEDLLAIRIEFLDNAGQSLLVDLDNDEIPESADFEVNAIGPAVDGAFFVRVTPVAGFEALVPQVAVTATDAAGHTGVRQTAKLASAPVRAIGQSCDPHGFDVCNTAAVCVPGVPGASNTCKAKSQLAAVECAAAPVLVPGGEPVTGSADGPSLWDAPPTCSSGDPTGRPEAIAVLRLSSPATKLTLTTELPGTNFDTVLYVLPGCGAAGAEPLGCSDDSATGGAAATLVLDLVPAGDYLVVVDAWGPEGGTFVLSASIE